jgi:hypothetical protein
MASSRAKFSSDAETVNLLVYAVGAIFSVLLAVLVVLG